MEDRDEVTSTSFRVVVSETEPYSFHACAAQQTHRSVRITHIAFTPPTAKELDAYARHRRLPHTRTPTVARVRTLGAAGESGAFAVASFPPAAASVSPAARLGGHAIALPRPADVCRGVDLRLDVDGAVAVEVAGPGRVTLFGEMYAALIPEWLAHHLRGIADEDDDEDEEDDEEEREWAEMDARTR